MPTPAKRYSKRLISLVESQNSQLTTLKRTIQQQSELLNNRKKKQTGKRVKIAGKFVFTTEEVLKSVQQAEQESSAKKAKKATKRTLLVEITSGSESPASILSEAVSILSEIVVNMQ